MGVVEEGFDCFEGRGIFPMTLKTYDRCHLLFFLLIKLGPSNEIWCFSKLGSVPYCFLRSQKMFI